MRALLLHVKEFESAIIEKSTWPQGIEPETERTKPDKMKNCLVSFFTVENGDGEKQVNQLFEEVVKTAAEVKTHNLMIAPFVHLSNNIATPEVSKNLYERLMDKFKSSAFVVKSTPFGYHKTLKLNVMGHPGAFRYREFNP